jgi:two-component system NarL family response regulator
MLLDLGLPGMPGIELIAQAKKMQPDLAILVYTAQTDRDILISTLKAGASGYILKGGKLGELIEALHSLHGGGAALSPQITTTVVREFHAATDNGSHVLSFREREILATLEKGHSYKKIAILFTLSVHTVHTHISKIFKKLGAKNRSEALVKARRIGIALAN